MRADNQGEGGTMALLSLAIPVAGKLKTPLLVVGLAGASLFFGDAMITPAISVLSAIVFPTVSARRRSGSVLPKNRTCRPPWPGIMKRSAVTLPLHHSS